MNLKTENRKLDSPLSIRDLYPDGQRVRVRVGRLRFPHLPIHLFTGLIFFALLTAALPAWATAKAEDVDNTSGLRFDGGLDVSKICTGHRFETAGWRDCY